jgi:hypothetical protein
MMPVAGRVLINLWGKALIARYSASARLRPISEIEGYATSPAAVDLEAALNGIDAIRDIIEKLAGEDSGWLFLVDRLQEQHDKASDAFHRIFKLGQHSEQAAALKKPSCEPRSRGWWTRLPRWAALTHPKPTATRPSIESSRS